MVDGGHGNGQDIKEGDSPSITRQVSKLLKAKDFSKV